MAKDSKQENLNKVDENQDIEKKEETKCRVLVNLKYNKEIYKIGNDIYISKKDLQEMLDKNLIELN